MMRERQERRERTGEEREGGGKNGNTGKGTDPLACRTWIRLWFSVSVCCCVLRMFEMQKSRRNRFVYCFCALILCTVAQSRLSIV